jgi:hypothetical protein
MRHFNSDLARAERTTGKDERTGKGRCNRAREVFE